MTRDSGRGYRLEPSPVAIRLADDARWSNPIFLRRDSAGTGGGTPMPYDQLLAERVRRALAGR